MDICEPINGTGSADGEMSKSALVKAMTEEFNPNAFSTHIVFARINFDN